MADRFAAIAARNRGRVAERAAARSGSQDAPACRASLTFRRRSPVALSAEHEHQHGGQRVGRRAALWAGLTALVVSYLIFVVASPETRHVLAVEDGPVENVGAAAWLGAALLAAMAYRRGRVPRARGLLALAAVFFMAFGEEIAWGQHALGFATPRSIAAVNVQGEVTLHNLAIVNHADASGRPPRGWRSFLVFSRLFNVAWFIYCVAIPLFNRIPAVRARLRRAGVPVVSLAAGLLCAANYVALKIGTVRLPVLERPPLTEWAESNFAVVAVVISTTLLLVADCPRVDPLPDPRGRANGDQAASRHAGAQ
jgi:hypothetical protein